MRTSLGIPLDQRRGCRGSKHIVYNSDWKACLFNSLLLRSLRKNVAKTKTYLRIGLEFQILPPQPF